MTVSERFHQAATRILAGDESIAAANELEGVLIDEYLGDERTEDLIEGLALYSPGSGREPLKPQSFASWCLERSKSWTGYPTNFPRNP